MTTGLTRTQYWTLGGVNPIPRTGLTARAESRTDVEGYLIPSDSARTAAFFTSGVADGLQVTAAVGDADVTVLTGTALDATGAVVVLAAGGRAVVDPTVGAGGVQNIPTVPVPAAGVALDTAVPDGDYVVTITWREVEDVDAGLLVLRQAPWLRLTDAFVDDGQQLPLALVSVAAGTVTALAAGPRRLAGLRSGGLELRRPSVDATVGQSAAVDLVARDDGGAQLRLLTSGGAPRTALAVSGATADVDIGAGLTLGGSLVAGGSVRAAGTVEATGDLITAANLTAQGDLAVEGAASVGGPLSAADVTAGGRLTVSGPLRVSGATKLNASLDVTGPLTANAAASFADSVTVTGAVGTDSLSVHGEATIGAGGDAVLRTRHVFGKQSGNDGDDDLFLNWSNGRAVHVGGGQLANLIVSGKVGVHTDPGGFDLRVVGTICAETFCNPSDARLKSDITDLVDVSARLSRVRPVTFVPRGSGTKRRQAGVLAQDLRGAFPELIVPMDDDEGHLAVDYAGLAGVLVGAVNELRAANAALERRIVELEQSPAGGSGAAAG